jgi:hypothetical protein
LEQRRRAGSILIEDSEFVGNRAASSRFGGAICIRGNVPNGDAIIRRSTFQNNRGWHFRSRLRGFRRAKATAEVVRLDGVHTFPTCRHVQAGASRGRSSALDFGADQARETPRSVESGRVRKPDDFALDLPNRPDDGTRKLRRNRSSASGLVLGPVPCVSIRIERERFAPICYLADPAVRESGPVSQSEGQPIDSWAVAETNLYDGALSDEPSVDPQDVSEARRLLSQQLDREVNAAAAIIRGDLPAIEEALAELEEVEAHAQEVLAATDSTKAERALAARTLAGIIPDEKAGTISLDEQRAALEARKVELSSQALEANAITANEAEKRAASDLLAIDVLQREFGLSLNGPPLEALAKAAGLKNLDEASIKGWARVAAGESHHPDVERAPLVTALSRLFIERESFNGADAQALQTLVAEGVKTRADLLARSSDPKVSLEVREATRKVLQHPELERAVMPHGTLDRRAIAALDQRRERLSQVGSDGRLLLDRFEARAADDARALSKAIAAGDTGAALSIIADRDQLGRAWLLEEYAAISGEGTLSRELEKLDARAAGSVAGALSLDVSERTVLLNGIVEDPPAGTTRATFQTQILESRLVGLDSHRAALAKRGNFAQRVAGVQANDAELAYLDATIARARNAVATTDPRAIERVATAGLAAEALADGRLQRTDRAIAVVQASMETMRALAISAGAAAVTLKTLGTAAPMAGGVVCSS